MSEIKSYILESTNYLSDRVKELEQKTSEDLTIETITRATNFLTEQIEKNKFSLSEDWLDTLHYKIETLEKVLEQNKKVEENTLEERLTDTRDFILTQIYEMHKEMLKEVSKIYN